MHDVIFSAFSFRTARIDFPLLLNVQLPAGRYLPRPPWVRSRPYLGATSPVKEAILMGEESTPKLALRSGGALLMGWHLVIHIGTLLRFLLGNPIYLYHAVLLSFRTWYHLGGRSTFGRISSRLMKCLTGPELANCPICEWLKEQKQKATQLSGDPGLWLGAFRPETRLLARFRSRRWPIQAPMFSVLMPVFNTPGNFLLSAIDSVRAQTYVKWQLICVDDGSTTTDVTRLLADAARSDPRVRVVRLAESRGVSAASNAGLREASGDYVCFLDHDDALEPHALHRFAEAVLSDGPDLLYSDEVICGAELDNVLRVVGRPQFSYDYYLSHPYFVHLVGVRTRIAREIGGFDETMAVSHDVDFILRVLERSTTVSHVSDVLYRWRTIAESLGHKKQGLVDALTVKAIRRHMDRLGCVATVVPVSFNVRDVTFRPPDGVKVAVIIPTKNQVKLLQACLASLEETVRPGTADIVVVDHQSDDAETIQYLAHVRKKHTVLAYQGPFNFSAMMNEAVRHLSTSYTHYLFLNNDIEALSPGWLEHMLGLGCRNDVGAVGATLVYSDLSIQHAGVIVGLMGAAEHLGKFAPLYEADGRRRAGYNSNLVSNRDTCAVTGACLLFRADVFEELRGFEERLAVGFGDTDICLRALDAGYKVLMDAHAVLIHHESASRGKSSTDPHPEDTRFFIARWHKMLREGDPFHSRILSLDRHDFALNPRARSLYSARARAVPVVLPRHQAAGVRLPEAAVTTAGGSSRRVA
jgi:glycosyltransferase involved in cell wall biosynthesis